jgi:large subunit ribosomal protein L20
MHIETAERASEIFEGSGSLEFARINAAARMNNLSYSKFIHGLKLADVRLDRKVLAELAVSDPSGFSKIASLASQQV